MTPSMALQESGSDPNHVPKTVFSLASLTPYIWLVETTAMLIITADDYGKSQLATDTILTCFANGRVTSASAMVFMEDSRRAARLAAEAGMEVGLHLNFTLAFNGPVAKDLRKHQDKAIRYLTRNKLSQVLYNPFLAQSFEYLARSQEDEFRRLYGKGPIFYNGHHHMHLCANVLVKKLIPGGARIRRSFTFGPREKGGINRLYRNVVDRVVERRFVTTDSFFSVEPVKDSERLRRILSRAETETVEVEVHPEIWEESGFLLSDDFRDVLGSVPLGGFGVLQGRS
ncbi:MAG: ChbG/HpnK family deacetylase [candidate division WOR-3 bacterium]